MFGFLILDFESGVGCCFWVPHTPNLRVGILHNKGYHSIPVVSPFIISLNLKSNQKTRNSHLHPKIKLRLSFLAFGTNRRNSYFALIIIL